MIQQYEICFITLKEENNKIIRSGLENCGAKIIFEQKIGRRKFAYPIKKEGAGFYASIYFSLDNKKIGEFRKNLLAEQEILRYLIVKNDIDVKKLVQIQTVKKPKMVKKPVVQKTEPTIETAPDPKLHRDDSGQGRKKIAKVKKTPKKIKPAPIKKEVKKIPEEIEKTSADEAERIKKLEEKLDELLKE